jgi:SNF2 family DNA or RNA helicase
VVDAELDLLLESRARSLRRAAEGVKRLGDVELPPLTFWNRQPCRHHTEPDPLCQWRACGGDLFKWQRKGVAWLYLTRKGILGDETGLGKTAQVIALLALLKERGELGRALIVCQPGAIEDPWLWDFRRFAPRMIVEPAVGPRWKRLERYAGGWDALVIGYQMMLRDYRVLTQVPFTVIVSDDMPPLIHPETATAKAFNRLAQPIERVVNINATPLNLRLQDLYAVALSCGGREEFGTLRQFERRYVRMEEIRVLSETTGRPSSQWKVVGYKNMREFKERFGPFYLRRKYDDPDVVNEVRIPSVAPMSEVWMDLSDRQRRKYRELQDEMVVELQRQGTQVRHVDAMTAWGYGAQICSGLFNLGEPDGDGASVKLDWFEDHITGDWADEKVVVFSQYKGAIRAMRDRLDRHGVGMALFWGDTPGDSRAKMRARAVEQDRFWNDPNCRIAVGTSAIERSLNLQVARIVVNYDLLMNPQRMVQILGRSRRVGSRHERVYPFTLLTRDTQEERYLPVLEQRAALADYVFDDRNALFKELGAVEMLHLIRP